MVLPRAWYIGDNDLYKHSVPTGLKNMNKPVCYKHSVPMGLKESRNQGINGMNALGHSPGMNALGHSPPTGSGVNLLRVRELQTTVRLETEPTGFGKIRITEIFT